MENTPEPASGGTLAHLRQRILHTRSGQVAGVAALLALAFVSPFVGFTLPYAVVLRPILVFLPSLLTLLALALLAAMLLGPGKRAVLAAVAAYLLIGTLLASLPFTTDWPDAQWLIPAWPTSILLKLGFAYGWWPDPGE